jgi:hypothetical protein
MERKNKMKWALIIGVILVMSVSPAIGEDLTKLSLDTPSALGTTIQSDSDVKTEGRASIRITTLHPTSICLGEVTDLNIENAKLIFKASVKSDLDGVAFLEMWAHVGGGRYFSRGMNDPVEGKTDWKSIRTPFLFQTGQRPEKVTLNLVINGKGTVWIDEVVLSKAPLS